MTALCLEMQLRGGCIMFSNEAIINIGMEVFICSFVGKNQKEKNVNHKL